MSHLTTTLCLTIAVLLGSVGVSWGGDPTTSIGSKIYLNACGGNPQSYKSKPLNLLDRIVEVPNIITKTKTSEYKRPFITEAKSSISLPNGKLVHVQLDNFRDLKIFDDNNNVLLSRKVTGATSIYEYRFQERVIAWGVGWHNECKEYYQYTDFTVLRTFVPSLENGKISVSNKILIPRVSGFKEFYVNAERPIFASAITIYGESKGLWCYYCGIEFFEINNTDGIIPLTTLADRLVDDYQIDFSSFEDLVPVLNFLSKEKQNLEFLKNFIRNNYKTLISNLVDNYYFNSIYDARSGFIHEDYLDYYPDVITKLRSFNLDTTKYVNPDNFSNKAKFEKNFERNCNLDHLQSYVSIALECVPYHFFYFDDGVHFFYFDYGVLAK